MHYFLFLILLTICLVTACSGENGVATGGNAGGVTGGSSTGGETNPVCTAGNRN